jgi:hypothetical protein
MSTTREKALKWWNNLPYDSSNTEKSRVHYTSKYYGINKSYSFLTGREIEEIYFKETLSLENDFLELDNMKKLGFELSEDHNDDGYYKYQNNGTIHYNKDYNRNFPEPIGKVLISVNTTYTTLAKENIPYIGIKQDGGTRSVYSGLCPNEDFLIQLLNNIR